MFHKPDPNNPELTEAINILKGLLMEADSVVCSRAIPKFKARLVRMVKAEKKVVLAIGDGANDVNMLTVV